LNPAKNQSSLFAGESGNTRPSEDDSNIREILVSSQVWKELSAALKQGIVPQSVVFFAPAFFHGLFVQTYARSLFSGKALPGHNPEEGWAGENHPDLLFLGAPGTAPGIEECRGLLAELSSRPVCAPCRLAVIHSAHRLSPPAANSLLKIAEEPPPRGHLLFLLEEDVLLPTLRSRSWCLRLPLEELLEPTPPPVSDEDWIGWLSGIGSGKSEGMLFNAGRWARWYALHGEFRKAADLDSFVTLAQKMRLSGSMVADLIFLMMREDISLENFFDPLR
jgi:DNA polymerase-3 subunit delta'